MPTLWEGSIEGHRRAVRDAITEATWQLAEDHGPLALTMSQVAKAVGIGRATLYKYFTDVESILIAHHAQHVQRHLQVLEELGGGSSAVASRLVAVVGAYASICFHRARHGSTDVSALVHRSAEVEIAERRLRNVFDQLIEEAVADALVRTDVSTEELAAYCLHALSAAGQATDLEQVQRLVRVVLSGLGFSFPADVGAGSATTTSGNPRASH